MNRNYAEEKYLLSILVKCIQEKKVCVLILAFLTVKFVIIAEKEDWREGCNLSRLDYKYCTLHYVL